LQFGESLFFFGEDYLISRLFIHNLADCLFVGKGAGCNLACRLFFSESIQKTLTASFVYL
jgi:hypothetical protein